MKKRRKNDDDSCLGQFVKTILLLACICWGVKTAMRTVVDNSWWLIGGIAVVSYLLVKLFKDDDYVSMHTCTLAVVLGTIIFTTNFYFPISTQQRQAVIQDLYVSGGKMRTTQCVLRFTDNGQKGKCRWRIQQGRLSSGRHRNRYLSARMPRNGCGEIRQMILVQ